MRTALSGRVRLAAVAELFSNQSVGFWAVIKSRHINLVARRLLVALAAIAAGVGACNAQEAIPAFKVLSCVESCKKFVPARVLTWYKPTYPSDMAAQDVEALVDVNYTITADGHVSDVVVERLSGPQVFADKAIESLHERTYAPATQDGVAVPQCNSRARFVFYLRDMKGARSDVVQKVKYAIRLATDGKVADAIASYKEILSKPRLNFYERTMVANNLAIMYVSQSKYDDALSEIDDATVGDGTYLSDEARSQAIRLRIQLEARAGQFSEALAWFNILKTVSTVNADDPLQQLVAKINAIMSDTAPFAVAGTITGDSWQHAPFHRTFTFQNIKGTLDHFILRCDKQTIQSPVSDKAQWTIPKSFSECRIYVFGTPGSTFNFVEEA